MAKRNSTNIPRIEALRVENYRALREVVLNDLTPLTVLLGPNGSGKSTIFDVFNFLSECFKFGLRYAWDRRGRGRELKTRGADGPIVFDLKYREAPRSPLITYHLAIDEGPRGPEVVEEWLQWRRGSSGKPFRFLNFVRGIGEAASGDAPDETDVRVQTNLRSADLIAVNTLGQFSEHPRVAALREFITDWYVSYLSIDQTRSQPEAGPQERLSKGGENLPNVVQYLKEQHPERLEEIFSVLQERIPRLERVEADPMPDGRLLLQIKDAPFDRPVLSKYASDGTLKMLAYLTVLYDPEPPKFIGIEEPENFLHPRLLPELAEECRASAERSQLLITTHSPFLLNAMRPEEVRVLYRDENGFTQVIRASDLPGVKEFIKHGSSLGYLWIEGILGVGDPLTNHGAPKVSRKRKQDA
ncbi:TPA: AAA family ATPase [Pseudomonas aeruginosa]|uniref:ATPase n=2 Tax=Pseudomonas aeruginosa TaxID=287 RepID=A0A7M2ZRZ8_PSEAI|nr:MULTISPECIES: AAA family ATPase [Pseudomonas]ECA4546820.1 ATPase [Salmonella enterica subsp. enterica serovar Typhimurium]HCL2590349.1 AAA family ATPase [Pseudomonas aeruginosa C40A]ARH18283.1 ATPase [Pseudomonas aeruginosa]AYW74110.1 ATPase [Pseudomonas aeruginosa]EIU7192213.1 AAA family ATPase [Pseudomonas aeruginosa]